MKTDKNQTIKKNKTMKTKDKHLNTPKMNQINAKIKQKDRKKHNRKSTLVLKGHFDSIFINIKAEAFTGVYDRQRVGRQKKFQSLFLSLDLNV